MAGWGSAWCRAGWAALAWAAAADPALGQTAAAPPSLAIVPHGAPAAGVSPVGAVFVNDRLVGRFTAATSTPRSYHIPVRSLPAGARVDIL